MSSRASSSREARAKEPGKGDEYGEDREEEGGPGILEVICRGEGERRGWSAQGGIPLKKTRIHRDLEKGVRTVENEAELRLCPSIPRGIQDTNEGLLSSSLLITWHFFTMKAKPSW